MTLTGSSGEKSLNVSLRVPDDWPIYVGDNYNIHCNHGDCADTTFYHPGRRSTFGEIERAIIDHIQAAHGAVFVRTAHLVEQSAPYEPAFPLALCADEESAKWVRDNTTLTYDFERIEITEMVIKHVSTESS